MEVLTINEIKAQYPDEWVLIGNPNFGNGETLGTIIKRIIGGIVLLHSKDKHEVAYKGKEARIGYDNVTLIFTGEIPKKRKFWLMKKFGFEIEDEDSLIVTVDCKVHGDSYTLALDTGASNTVIDLAALIILGYEIKNSIRTVEFETAKGSLFAYVFLVEEITALGITRKNMEICSYDFFNNNIFSDMHGVLGLDFFRDCKLCIDMVEQEITVVQKNK